MKKLSVLILAAIMAISMSGCSYSIEKTEEDVKKVVENFFKAKSKQAESFEGFLENIDEFIDTEGSLYEEIDEEITELDEFSAALARNHYVSENLSDRLFLTYTAERNKREKIEIKEVNVDGKTAEVTVEVIDLSDISFEAVVGLMRTEQAKCIESTYGSNEQYYKLWMEASAEERTLVATEVNTPAFLNAIKNISNIFDDAGDKTKELIVVLNKIDGKWLITETKD